MATRASTRYAAQKAKEAITSSADVNPAGSKRKATAEKPKPAKKVKDAPDSETKSVAQPNNLGTKADVTTEDTKVKAGHTAQPHLLTAKSLTVKPEDGTPKIPSIMEINDHKEPPKPTSSTELGIRKSEEREDAVPSNILEKGIIYFFYRPRVNVEDPQGLEEIARSFAVLRPTPLGGELDMGQGPIDKDARCRLIMLPKKKFPTSHNEKDMAFVEKAGQSMKDLQDNFIASTTYQTKTQGERTTQEAKPYAEGVYAITSTKRTSHLAYIITLPKEMGEVQESFGLHERGSWIVQSKNPKFPGPPIGQLPKEAEYPESVQAKFGDLRWVPLQPEFIEYPNSQILLIGEAQDKLGKAGISDGLKEPHEVEPGQELQKLEEENEQRTKSLEGNQTVFEDLGMHAKNYPALPTTWNT